MWTFFDVKAWLVTTAPSSPTAAPAHPSLPNSGPTIWDHVCASAELNELAALINQFSDLVSILNGKEEATFFVPPSTLLASLKDLDKQALYTVLAMHISANYLPSTRLSSMTNIPVVFSPATLNGNLCVNIRPDAGQFVVNHHALTTAVDAFFINGVIHHINKVLLPPPSSLDILAQLPPSQFSAFQNAMLETGLVTSIRGKGQKGGIIFIPTNTAFEALGAAVNEFLFSAEGESYLRVLLKYHVVLDETFYSNIHYKNPALSYDYEHKKLTGEAAKAHEMRHIAGVRRRSVTSSLGPLIHIDLERNGGVINMKVNGAEMLYRDANAIDGVLHVVSKVFVPPEKGSEEEATKEGEWQVAELKARLGEYL
ncbi:FAS1 domain-containing protein [Mycena floridula]|nr:FAS1 domain-containing protein [Mycena floridula]